jgi:hypothetical protein
MTVRKKPTVEVVHKEQITNLLLAILSVAERDTRYSDNFELDLQKRLKFQKITDIKKFRASIDLLDDTEYALFSFFKYQLGDLKSENKDFGELYIRLYGILNAVYLQISAFEELSKLLNYPKRVKISKDFKKLEIYKLRGIAGSHTIDYLYDNETFAKQNNIHRTTSFRIVQMYLEKTAKKIVAIDENNISFEYNLYDSLLEYERIATKLLISLINHSINQLVNDKETKSNLKERLDELLPNLIDYSKLDENKKHHNAEMKRIKRMVSKHKKVLEE